MPQEKTKSSKEANRKRPLSEDRIENNLDYNDVANLTGASPIVPRGKSKLLQKKKSSNINTTNTKVSTKQSDKQPFQKKPSLPKQIVSLDDSPIKTKPKSTVSPISSPLPIGTKVLISKDTENHTEFRGKIGKVYSQSSSWTKVDIVDNEGTSILLSFRKNDLEEVSSSSTKDKKTNNKKRLLIQKDEEVSDNNDNKKIKNINRNKLKEQSSHKEESEEFESYPHKEDGEGYISKSIVSKVFGPGDGLVDENCITTLTDIVLKHEIDFLREHANTSNGKAVITLLESIAESCSENMGSAVKASRRRRFLSSVKSQEIKYNEMFLKLQHEEKKWLHLLNKVNNGEVLDITKEVEFDNDELDESTVESEVSDMLKDVKIVNVHEALQNIKENIETISLTMNEQVSKIREVEDVSKRAIEMERKVVAKNKIHHFDNYCGEAEFGANEPTDLKELLFKKFM